MEEETEPGTISYDEAKKLACHKDSQVRKALAARADVMPEILYFLADDPSPEVRRTIAENAAAPRRADVLLARDSDESVRSRLARKIASIAPELSEKERDRIGQMTFEALDILARDQMTRVRQILSEALKDVANAPPEVIRRLARDAEQVVAGPVLENSPVLTDEDLLEIIAEGAVSWALSAISRRQVVSEAVCDAVVSTQDEEAVSVLLGNHSAQIREETLDLIVERAPAVKTWHAPLVRRPALPAKAARRLADFVADSLLKVLAERENFDPETTFALRDEVRRRLDGGEADKADTESATGKAEGKEAADSPSSPSAASSIDTVLALKKSGELSASTVLDALSAGDLNFVVAALSVLADMPANVAEKIVAMQSAKGIVALAWRAGIPAHSMPQLQSQLGRVHPERIIRAKDPSEYPMTGEEMRWQLDFFYQLVSKQQATADPD